MPSNISVALATYNGDRYLPDFLDSLLRQEILPAELIVCDDCSEDGTITTLESFTKKAPFAVKVFRNPTRLGVTRNFSRAISLCSSEFIALADQDDVWLACKLGYVKQSLIDTVAVFSDAEVVSENLNPIGYTMWQRVCFSRREQRLMESGEPFKVLLKHRIVTGATLGFRRSLCDALLPIPPQWPHDAWIAFIASAVGGLYPISKPLISYRQHDKNVTGGQKKSFFAEMRAAKVLDRVKWYREEIERLQLLRERLETVNIPTSIQEKLIDKVAHLESRLVLPKSRFKRLPGVVCEVVSGRYVAYSRNWGSIAIDLLVK